MLIKGSSRYITSIEIWQEPVVPTSCIYYFFLMLCKQTALHVFPTISRRTQPLVFSSTRQHSPASWADTWQQLRLKIDVGRITDGDEIEARVKTKWPLVGKRGQGCFFYFYFFLVEHGKFYQPPVNGNFLQRFWYVDEEMKKFLDWSLKDSTFSKNGRLMILRQKN